MFSRPIYRLVDQFWAVPGLPEQTELVEGLIYEVTPEGDKASHAQVLVALASALPDWWTMVRQPLRVTRDFCLIPNVSVYPGSDNPSSQLLKPSTLPKAEDAAVVVEILSGELRTSRLRAYAEGRVPELWLVEPGLPA